MKKLLCLLGLTLGMTAFTQELEVKNLVKELGLEELAMTYDGEKLDEETREMSLLVDLDLVDDDSSFKELSNELAFASGLLGDTDKNYLGYVSDKDIYREVLEAWESFTFYTNKELVDDLSKGMLDGIYTGYNIKKTNNLSNFNTDLEMTYGHSDIKHAIQLIALLKTEDIEARVQLEPKTSSFVYLKEWGEPRNTENYKVVKNSGDKWLAYAKEYDLSFEFVTAKDKEEFKKIVTKYAKKDVADEKGLIHASWWQPLYYTRINTDNHSRLVDNIINRGEYEIHIFSLEDKSAPIQKYFKKNKSTTRDIYVNQGFYNYMLGDYK